MPKFTHPGADRARLPARAGAHRRLGVRRPRRHRRRPRPGLPRRGAAFYDAGARYLQFDDTAWAYLCSDVELEKARERGIDTDGIAERYAALLNRVARRQARRPRRHDARVPRQLPLDLDLVGRLRAGRRAAAGRHRRTTATSSSTTASAPAASSRCGSCPRATRRSCSGSSRPRAASSRTSDAVKKRIDEASAFAPLEQLALSPQCGFASTEEGNVLTEDEQWAKIREVVAIADDVWR